MEEHLAQMTITSRFLSQQVSNLMLLCHHGIPGARESWGSSPSSHSCYLCLPGCVMFSCVFLWVHAFLCGKARNPISKMRKMCLMSLGSRNKFSSLQIGSLHLFFTLLLLILRRGLSPNLESSRCRCG